MSKQRWIILIGIWLIVLPFLGFTSVWKTGLLIATGVVLLSVAFRLRPDPIIDTGDYANSSVARESPPFVEHKAGDINNDHSPTAS